ncbi:hypothetical protein LOC67_04065 [Stieleria sp. JC731]|uniref:hypothetical protein n=1 Tax=Pirellulaceae TaxID=2691357 RepID=UPI001E59DA0A|nr:hypothetical protein [Stieleria sp. JC731]MCC9599726.1 hypothetical protein [Stieleria sp. JC731]
MHLELPTTLTEKLDQYRQAVIRRSMSRGIQLSIATTTIALLLLVVIDRFAETPVGLRLAYWMATAAIVGYAIASVVQSIRQHRSAASIAREITQYDPNYGDHLLGAIELADSAIEQQRSMRLCRAALQQVSEETQRRNLLALLPPQSMSRCRRVTVLSAVVLATLAFLMPDVIWNSVRRMVMPLASISRQTLVHIDHVPDQYVVPRGEPANWIVPANKESRWTPGQAALSIEGVGKINGSLADEEYRFELPPLMHETDTRLTIGDASRPVRLVPVDRPEIASVRATVELPSYLQIEQSTIEVEPVANVIQALENANVTLHVQATSPLSSASADGEAVEVDEDRFDVAVDAERSTVTVDLADQYGIGLSKESTIQIERTFDQPPTIVVDEANLPSRVLNQQQLRFLLSVEDDFAVRRVGVQWINEDRSGERVIGPEEGSNTVTALFNPAAFGTGEGEVAIRFWAEDDLPGRPRVYTQTYSMTVLSSEDHAVWIGDQLARWRQGAIEVRDRELRLLSGNRELMSVPESQRDTKWRQKLAEQAAAEADNARRLKLVVEDGKAILSQAAANDQVPAANLEGLAQSIRALDDLANGKMPQVAEMLSGAAEAFEESKFAAAANMETTLGELPDTDEGASENAETDSSDPSSTERLSLSDTTIIDTSKSGKKAKPAKKSSKQQLAQAVEDQAELVAEFDAVADQLRELLGQMDGSTLVKRMKAISRLQDRVAGRLAKFISVGFGLSNSIDETDIQASLSDTEETISRLQSVMDDLQAFLKRREVRSFKVVYEEMKQDNVLDQLRLLKRHLPDQPGASIAAAEYWADNLDRLADDLIEPPSNDEQQDEEGGKAKKSLDPEVVLEVLRVLKSEVDLREETRQAERGRKAMAADDYASEAIRLSESQDSIRDRLDQVIDSLQTDRDSAIQFAAEAEVLSAARAAMVDASETMVQPDTGPSVIAAQTEAIELLLRSRKVDPSTGGASNSASSSGGDTDQEAIKLVGDALNEMATQRSGEVSTTTGASSFEVPQRMRADLDRYFMRLEQRLGGVNQ